jgi:hypothetical protein
MQKHVKNYHKAMGLDPGDWIFCEFPGCGCSSSDIHHIEPRSAFGSKMKATQDAPENLIALCRHHHAEAHGPKSKELKETFKQIVKLR